MSKCRIKKGDTVVVISGKEKGSVGTVDAVLKMKAKPNRIAKDGYKVVIKGVNMVTRATKANPQQEKPGGLIRKEAPLAVCKVAIYNPATKKADKVGYKMLANGEKVRVFRKNGEVIGV